MDPIGKLKNKRGISLIEVLLVVALMSIMLGVAMPNLLAESEKMKMTELNGNARAVAVAVQSRLYGMKNAGTAADSSYANLNEAADKNSITTADEEKAVNYVCNFGENAEIGKQYLFSDALTDLDLLQNGKIVVVYDPVTADVLEVYYSEKEFTVTDLFPAVTETFLETNKIGLYRGEGAPSPERVANLPKFTAIWGNDDEKYLELTMIGTPEPELLTKHLGLEVYALLPKDDPDDPDGKWDPLLIYAEGLVATDYMTSNVDNSYGSYASGTIASETSEPLTLEKIRENDGTLRFAIDSMVISRAAYNSASVKKRLYRQNYPGYVSAAESLLYPRDSFDYWLNKGFNPYLSFGIDAGYPISDDLSAKLDNKNTKVTDYVAPDEMMELRVKLYVLEEDERGGYATEPVGENALSGSRYVRDEKYTPVVIDSPVASPYFYSISSVANEISLASMRDLQNFLKYGFETGEISRARLYHDIDVQEFYDKLVFVRYALIEKSPEVKNLWSSSANADTLQVDQIAYADGKSNGRGSFTITGEKSDGGRYAIKNVQTGGAGWDRGGFIEYAKNITVQDLDIVNPKIWKISYKANFINTDNNGKITGINVEWDNSVSGGLFGVAENCTFKNVHCYNDSTQNFKQEPFEAESYQPQTWVPSVMATRYISGSVAGGLVGIAVGTKGGATTFTNCSASTQINSYYYGAMTQCVYAGGLVGIAMGNVTIENSYAACQLSGYYSGGLVGAVANVPFTYHVNYRGHYWHGDTFIPGWWEAEYENGLSGTLTIENSFSAGHIQRQTMVGGGLIAQTNGVGVTVKNCYSASVWEILPPFAYGTFEGDTSNYYLVQDEINVPITLNTEARFKRTAGDVLSLNSRVKCGNAVTVEGLKSKFKSDTNWKEKASRTLQWRNKGNSGAPTFFLPTDAEQGSTEDRSTPYPFPMPKDNTEFRGDWNNDDAKNIGGIFATDFNGFYCVYFKRSDDGYQRFIDASAVYEFEFSDTTAGLQVWNKTVINSVTKPEDIWWASQKANSALLVAGTDYGTGVAGMTEVTTNGTNITFTGAPYYNSNYNPTKGYDSVDSIGEKEGESRYLNWDYYGWYVSNGLLRIGYLTPSDTGNLSNSSENFNFTVTEQKFKEAVGYTTFTFNKNAQKINISYENGYFRAVGV